MLDVNRCLYLTSQSQMNSLASPGTYFQKSIQNLCKIRPVKKLTEVVKEKLEKSLETFEEQMKRNKDFDSGLSLAEERTALLHEIIQHI